MDEIVNSTVDAAVYRSDGIRVYGLDAELEKKVFESILSHLIMYCVIIYLTMLRRLKQSEINSLSNKQGFG